MEGPASPSEPNGRREATGPAARGVRLSPAAGRPRRAQLAVTAHGDIDASRSPVPADHGLEARLLDLAFDAILVRTFDSRIVTYWNRGASALYGWSREEALGRSVPELLHAIYPIPLEAIEEQVAKGGRWQGQLRHVDKEGFPLVVMSRWALQRSADGSPEAILEINSDLTRSVVAEQQLQASEDMFRLLVSGVKDLAIFMLDPAGHVATWNDGAERIKGYRADEIVGRHFSVFYPEHDVESGKPDWELVVAERDGRFEDEGWRVRKDGTRFWANMVVTALRDEHGTLRGYAKVTRDITDRKLAEQRRAEVQRRESEQLREHVRRMAQLEKTKSEFLNLASHELRGPLAVLKGYLSMFEDETMTPQELPEILPMLSGKLQQMELLVQQMLETARLEANRLSLNAESFDLREVAERVVGNYQLFAHSTHEITLATPEEAVLVRGDRARLETVVSNLVDNAIKYSPHGGIIRCLVASRRERAFVSVQDTGLGIAEEAMDSLFTRFGRIVTPENSHISGTGLGLYLAREIVRRHGGDILVKSREGSGSQFTVVLPRQVRAAASRAAL